MKLGTSRRSGLFPFEHEAYPRTLTPGIWNYGIRSLPDFSKLVGPLGQTVLYNRN